MNKHFIAGAMAALSAFNASALSAGDIAIIGRINNTTPDSFAFVTLAPISAGTVIYFTDNGWLGTAYRNTVSDRNGNEGLTRWTAASAVSAGTVVSSTSASFSTAGSIAGTGTSANYSALDLSQSGDQIYAFQGASADPLTNVGAQTALYVLDDTNGFETTSGTGTGGIPTGLVAGTTAVTLNFPVAGGISVKSSVLAGPEKTRDQWLATFASAANWEATSTLPISSIAVTPVPEPGTYALMLAGLAAVGALVRRRRGD